MKNAVITGNIFYNKLSVEDGAIVNGLCQKCENEELDNRINISLENFHNNENFITTNLSSGSQSSQKIDQNDISISDKSENSNIAISCNNSAVINDEDII